MDKLFLLVLSLILVLAAGCASSDFQPGLSGESGDLSIVSLNIHYLVPDNDKTDWENRKGAVTESLKDLNADIVLFQEMETFDGGHAASRNLQLDWVMSTVEGYVAAASGDPSEYPITQPILFRQNRFDLLDQGFFFFSETPDLIYSEPWSGSWPAFVTWILLQDQSTGQQFYVYNTHLDAFSRKNRSRGTELIRDRIIDQKVGNAEVILAGDFNALKGAAVLRVLPETGMSRAPIDGSTFHFGTGKNLYGAIDHIYYSQGFQLVESGAVQRQWAGAWPSDHYPIYSLFRW
jgi:endonuclease/exonuclease/phosphatase family metal-dependent hydrolase